MTNTCFQCGIYRADKIIDPDGPVAICPECGYRHRFAQLPLLIVSGASGSGKSTVCQILLGRSTRVVILDSDISPWCVTTKRWRNDFVDDQSGAAHASLLMLRTPAVQPVVQDIQ